MKTKETTLALGLAACLAALALGAADKVYKPDMDNCAGFTAADAALVLNLPAADVTAKTEKIHDTLWMCTFRAARTSLSFSVELAESAVAASIQMQRYRENLEVAAGTAAYRGRLPRGAWSEVLPLGDDSTWTDINHTLTVRLGNLTIQVQPALAKSEQIKVMRAVLKKLKETR